MRLKAPPTSSRSIEPGARQPGRQIGQQSAADAACLLDVQHTAAQQAQADEQQRRRQVQQHRPQHPHRYRQSQGNGRQVADCHLHRRHRQQRQHIAEDEVPGGKGRGVQPLQKGALPVTGHQSGGEQGHKRQTEHGDARGQAVDRSPSPTPAASVCLLTLPKAAACPTRETPQWPGCSASWM